MMVIFVCYSVQIYDGFGSERSDLVQVVARVRVKHCSGQHSVKAGQSWSRQSTEANSSVRVSRFETDYEAVQLTRSTRVNSVNSVNSAS
uniref:Uncharacterized protein n=1 Tax=Helianthus annuus TaxID=4232 RepID=A0A251SFL7_HELAN